MKDGEYIQLEQSQDEIVCSQIFPGLWLDESALLAGDLMKVISILQQGLSTPEHQEFVSRINAF